MPTVGHARVARSSEGARVAETAHIPRDLRPGPFPKEEGGIPCRRWATLALLDHRNGEGSGGCAHSARHDRRTRNDLLRRRQKANRKSISSQSNEARAWQDNRKIIADLERRSREK